MVSVYVRYTERCNSDEGIAQIAVSLEKLTKYSINKQKKIAAYATTKEILRNHFSGVEEYRTPNFYSDKFSLGIGEITADHYEQILHELNSVENLKIENQDSHRCLDSLILKTVSSTILP